MPNYISARYMFGKGHQLRKLEEAKEEVEAEITCLKLDGQVMARELRYYEGLADTVAYNLEMAAFAEDDYEEMNMNLEEWRFWVKSVRKEIYKQIDEITMCYSELNALNIAISELLH